MKSHDDWSPAAASSAFIGMAIVFLVWWWYYDRAEVAGERTMRTRGEAVRGHIWGYAHFPLYLGIVVLGVGIERAVEAASRTSLAHMDVWVMSGAAAAIGLSMAALAGTSMRARGAWGVFLRSVALAAPVIGAVTVSGIASPVGVVATLAALCVGLALMTPVPPPAPLHAGAARQELA
jgi:low temperature requirement protein LtrA